IARESDQDRDPSADGLGDGVGMIQGTIHADGIDWAAQTYVEALGFRELDRFVPPVVDQETRVIVIDRRLEVRGPQYASQIDWADALAFRTLDYTPEAKPCRVCGQ
ncbi:hypothetical protein OY671_012236, partial [Metschnikowia pulcherrima]